MGALGCPANGGMRRRRNQPYAPKLEKPKRKDRDVSQLRRVRSCIATVVWMPPRGRGRRPARFYWGLARAATHQQRKAPSTKVNGAISVREGLVMGS